jgi:hypothetical protein
MQQRIKSYCSKMHSVLLHDAAGSRNLPPHDAAGSKFVSRESSIKS